MAIPGSGAELDPYVVHDWDEFCVYKDTSGVYIKFANPHEGQTIQGSGTTSNPYIVSSYEEMLTATGAQYIWQCKLVNRDAKRYKYGDIVCIYDDSLSTIDFNTIQPEGFTAALTMRCAGVNFNGWTLFNIKSSASGALTMSATIKNLRLSNMFFESGISGASIIRCNSLSDSVLDIYANSLVSSAENIDVLRSDTATSPVAQWNSLSINLKARGTGTINMGYSSSNYRIILNNSVINLDCDCYNLELGDRTQSASLRGMNFNNCLIKGDIKTTNAGNIKLGCYFTNCIYDLSYTGAGKLSTSWGGDGVNFYNSEKVDDTTELVRGIMPATTANLKDAEWLYSQGFPIGV